MKVKAWAAACLLAAAGTTASAQVDDRQSRESVLEALRRQRAELDAERFAPAPSLAAPRARPRRAAVDGELPCATVEHLVVHGLPAAERALRQEFEPFAGRCLGAASLEALRANLDLRLAEDGLITTRAMLLPQALADGRLEVVVQPGRVETVVATDGRRGWKHALSIDDGDVLDVHRLDAALDHFNRLGGVPAQFRLEPGSVEGTTRVVLVRGAPAAPRWLLAADNGGTREFGRAQADLVLLLDEPLGHLDQLRLSAGSNAEPGTTSRSLSLHYSVPWSSHLLSVDVQAAWRRQPVRGTTVEFESRGRDRTLELRWDWAAWRDGDAKLGPWLAWRDRRSGSDLDGVELVVQRRHRLVRELGVRWWQRAAALQWSLEASHGEGRRRGAANPFVPDDGVRTRTDRLQFRLAADPTEAGWAWQVEARAQHGRRPASGAELFVIGSPSSVRGHAPDDALAADSGVLLRLELALPASAGQGLSWQPYLGWDAGVLRGPAAASLPARRLAGAAAGLRVAAAGSIQADLSLSTALDGPASGRPGRWLPALSIHFQI